MQKAGVGLERFGVVRIDLDRALVIALGARVIGARRLEEVCEVREDRGVFGSAGRRPRVERLGAVEIAQQIVPEASEVAERAQVLWVELQRGLVGCARAVDIASTVVQKAA